jgi:hypothetical protein
MAQTPQPTASSCESADFSPEMRWGDASELHSLLCFFFTVFYFFFFFPTLSLILWVRPAGSLFAWKFQCLCLEFYFLCLHNPSCVRFSLGLGLGLGFVLFCFTRFRLARSSGF